MQVFHISCRRSSRLGLYGGAMWMRRDLSAALVDERKKLSGNLHEEMTEITKERADLVNKFRGAFQNHESVVAEERKAIAGKVTEIASSLITSTQKKDDVTPQIQIVGQHADGE